MGLFSRVVKRGLLKLFTAFLAVQLLGHVVCLFETPNLTI